MDDHTDDNIVRLDRLREKRPSRLGKLDDAALKKLRRDSQAALEARIDRFNKEYAVVNETGKVWIFHWAFDPAMQRKLLERIKPADFRAMYENEGLTVYTEDPKTNAGIVTTKSVVHWWLRHPRRRQYLGGVTFDPTGQAPPNYWNLWSGFSVEPKRGDWGRLRGHIEDVLCDGKTFDANYVLNWMARSVQLPSVPGEIIPVFRGPEGCGKGMLGRWYVALFGQHGMQINSSAQLVGRFNEHLRDLLALFGDEAFLAGDKQHEAVLKGLATEPFLVIEGKGLRVVLVPNRLHIVLASNEEWVVSASQDERRFALFDVPRTRINDYAYFDAIDKQMRGDGLAAMLYDLLQRDISGFEVRDRPQGKALETQRLLSLDSIDRWWLAVLEREVVWRSRHGVKKFDLWNETCSTQLLYASYLQWCRDTRASPQRLEVLGIRMTRLYPATRPSGEQIVGEVEVRGPRVSDASLVIKSRRAPGYRVGSIEGARARFAEIHKISGTWSQHDDAADDERARQN